jgi:cytoskeletal protein RodZ
MVSLGEIFKTTRIQKKLSLEDVEKRIKVRKKFLEAIEANNWYFSSRIYVEGIIKNYSQILGLNTQKILAFFRRDYEKKEDIGFRKKIKKSFLVTDREKRFKLFFFVFLLVVLIYFGYQIIKYFSPPKIVILSPTKTTFINEKKIKIVGKTIPGSEINISGNKIYPDKTGKFYFDYPLTDTKNKIIIEVVGPNGRKNSIEKIYYLKNIN